jgi:DNA-binding transcriptional ArsR family regulator
MAEKQLVRKKKVKPTKKGKITEEPSSSANFIKGGKSVSKIIKDTFQEKTAAKKSTIGNSSNSNDLRPFPKPLQDTSQEISTEPSASSTVQSSVQSSDEILPTSTQIQNQDSIEKEELVEDKTLNDERIVDEADLNQVSTLDAINEEYEQLSPLQKSIITIAKSVLKKKKYKSEIKVERVEFMSPLVEELYSKCIAKLTHTRGISKEEIFETIQQLNDGYWIVTDQRRTKKEILENPILKNVLKFIQNHPGTHARDPQIEKEVKITRNPFIKHVMVLESFKMVRSKKIGRTLNYFAKNVPEIFDDFVVLFQNPIVPQIINFIREDPKIGLSEIARKLGVYHGAIQYHMKTLKEKNIIIKTDHFTVNTELLKRYNSLFKDPPFS